LVVHGGKIYDIVYDDIKTKAIQKWHGCLSKSFDIGLEVVMGWRRRGFWCIWKGEFQFASIAILHD